MNTALDSRFPNDRRQEIEDYLNGSYWENDIWDIRDSIFNEYPHPGGHRRTKLIRFDSFSYPIKQEMQYYYSYKLQNHELCLYTLLCYRRIIIYLADFLSEYAPELPSIRAIDARKAVPAWISYLTLRCRIKVEGTTIYKAVLCAVREFFLDFYDTREEYDKDKWNFRKIPGSHFTKASNQHTLSFLPIPIRYRGLAKRYIKYRSTFVSINTCFHSVMGLRYLFCYLMEAEPEWTDLVCLSRRHIEGFLAWYAHEVKKFTSCNLTYLSYVRRFLEYIQLAEYAEAPEIPCSRLFLPGDIPLRRRSSGKKVRYIPEGVLQQLEDNLECLSPALYIPIVILLRATGWRASDILALRYDNCLERTPQGWYICGDISKTQVLNHHVPITDEIKSVVQAAMDAAIKKSTEENNPNRLLFPVYEGKRKGLCVTSASVSGALNRMANRRDIVDDEGKRFRFGNHAFRHTKAVELINNGMSLLHVQKWMAHTSPEMTLVYAQILDTTMRKSWEDATRKGLFRIDETGRVKQIDLSEIENEDLIEWEYIRHNLDAVRMPLGYCMKPKKQECHTQLNPCLTCRASCTTPDFIPQYECEIRETKVIIERGVKQNREVWVQKNQALLERYEAILSVLKAGKTHYAAGKQGREYVGEERAV